MQLQPTVDLVVFLMYANDALMMGMNYLLCYLESNDDIIKQTLCTVNSGNDFATKCISILIHDNRRSVAKQQITKVGVYIQNSTQLTIVVL